MDEDEYYDPLTRRCEQAKAWTAGSLAVLLGSFVIGIHVLVAVALIGVVFWSGRWIQLASRLRQREQEVAEPAEPAAGPARECDPSDAPPPSNIIQFPR